MSHQNTNGVALITGASAGIGATYADRLARRGYDLLLVARDEQRLEELAGRLRSETGVSVEVLRADLTQRDDLARVEERLRSDAKITLLLNNAGIIVSGPLAGADLDRIESMILLNVVAPTRLAGAVVPGFVARGRGVIINITSILALAPEILNGSYSGTKAYLLNLSQSLHEEVGKSGVRVQAVLPGATRTEMWEKSGVEISNFPESILMGVDEMVDAALVGLDLGELVTIPSLPDTADWESFTAARLALGPNLSRNHAADRYKGLSQ